MCRWRLASRRLPSQARWWIACEHAAPAGRCCSSCGDLGSACASRTSPSRSPSGAWPAKAVPRAASRRCRGSAGRRRSGASTSSAMLMERWAWAKDGEGQVVLISGEPGIGSYARLRALRDRAERASRTRAQRLLLALPQQQRAHPMIAQLKRAAGFAPEDAPEARYSKS